MEAFQLAVISGGPVLQRCFLLGLLQAENSALPTAEIERHTREAVRSRFVGCPEFWSLNLL